MSREGTNNPVRVVIVDGAVAFGGTLTVVRNLVRHLDPEKVEVTVITACTEPFLDGYASSRVAVHLCFPYLNYKRIHEWGVAIRKHIGVNWLSRFVGRSIVLASSIVNLPYSLRVGILCARARAQIVHYNQIVLGPFRVTHFLRRRTVLHLHGLLPSVPASGARKALRLVRAYIAISACVHDAAVRAGIPEELIYRIPNFVEKSPDASPAAPPVTPTIGIFGRVLPWKGQMEFLAAARIVMQRFPDARALVVGGAADWAPDYFDECVNAVQEWGLSKRVEFVGMVSDVSSYYQRCSVVVHASIEPEPFGMVIIEAMAEGRPVVASSLGAGGEIVLNSGSGFVADPRDPQELAEKICMLLADKQLAERMGNLGFREVQKHYDPRIVARSFESFYQRICQDQPRRAQAAR